MEKLQLETIFLVVDVLLHSYLDCILYSNYHSEI